MPAIQDKTDELRSSVRGQVVVRGDPGYDAARQIWNAMIDRCPAVIVRCADAADVPPAIRFARENGLDISIRGAGHGIAGTALCDDGLTIDFSTMKKVVVEAGSRRAFAEPGATLADFDAATQAHGLAAPMGINSTTGVAGLTLGGGFGWLTRKYGMTVDNLLSAEMVTADGVKRKVSDQENPDLFWAIRGGGGNFGVVTRFEYKLHPVGPEVLAGLVVYPFEQAKRVLTQYREFAKAAPEEMTVWFILRQAPPLPFLAPDVHGKKVVVLPVFYMGDIAEGRRLIEPLSRLGDPHAVHIGPQPFVAWQQAFDPLLTPGARNYWKTHNFTELSDGVLDAVIEFAGRLPSPQCEIFVGQISGASNRVPKEAMAWAHRDTNFVLNVHARWNEPAEDQPCVAWARAFFKASAPFASGGAYVNFMTSDEGDRVAAAYGPNYDRLVQIKRRYDPENIFHFNQNIRP